MEDPAKIRQVEIEVALCSLDVGLVPGAGLGQRGHLVVDRLESVVLGGRPRRAIRLGLEEDDQLPGLIKILLQPLKRARPFRREFGLADDRGVVDADLQDDVRLGKLLTPASAIGVYGSGRCRLSANALFVR
jgi:hypothetical protein